MKKNKTLRKTILILIAFYFYTQNANSQKIDTDSLLTVIIKDMQTEKNYSKNIERALLATKIAPTYLDYYLLLGRNYDLLNKKDSARYFYKFYISKNPKNEEAYTYLINNTIASNDYGQASNTIENAIAQHPENRDFQQKKIILFQLQKEPKKELNYLKELLEKYPNDTKLVQDLEALQSTLTSDRLGLNYSYTNFSRDFFGPWHLSSINYIADRTWGSIIGRISYAERLINGTIVAKGTQIETESYINTGKKSYSYLTLAYSPDLVFPKYRLGYSFYQNFIKGWEADLGLRYIATENINSQSLVLGLGKYLGSYWLNLRSFLQKTEQNYNTSIALTARYYFGTKFDYFSFISGIGTSPDERTTIGQFEQRVNLNSWRFGAGYQKLFKKHYLVGLQSTFNKQEYAPNLKQNEIEISVVFQYKF